jgi:hypothetical protein
MACGRSSSLRMWCLLMSEFVCAVRLRNARFNVWPCGMVGMDGSCVPTPLPTSRTIVA